MERIESKRYSVAGTFCKMCGRERPNVEEIKNRLKNGTTEESFELMREWDAEYADWTIITDTTYYHKDYLCPLCARLVRSYITAKRRLIQRIGD